MYDRPKVYGCDLYSGKYGIVFLDIGDVVVKCATDEEVVQSLRSLPPSERYAYLHRHVKPEDSFTCLTHWLKEHVWLCYSIKLDGAF